MMVIHTLLHDLHKLKESCNSPMRQVREYNTLPTQLIWTIRTDFLDQWAGFDK